MDFQMGMKIFGYGKIPSFITMGPPKVQGKISGAKSPTFKP